ncbi:flavin monoamine oxidase family protein [Rhodococcus jostii]|uniref:Monoamine oxidase n=1 Tax=Rhodococcus jostii TaxID=132919 RepID=A0A1H4JIS5_RHOJO|nr:NAD(P)/FAD-dependent oxidoreductase [Rhodococcus jostii]SEB46173.1 Monoamine oxidase [Rhodococcus jostii]
MHYDYDVIVIGAGFAGATAARECSTRGLRTVLLEARDRVGGRTWTSRLTDGELIEIGGTYVHWLQPHTWSEISRYGLDTEIVAGAEPPEWALVPAGSGLKWYGFEEHERREKALLERFFEPSRGAVPRPFDPQFAGEMVADLDQLSVRDRLDQMDLSPDDDAYLAGLLSLESGDDVSKSSFLTLMRWWALSGHNYEANQEAVFGYKLARGTVSLINAMIADGGAELRLNDPVTAVTSDQDGVRVDTASHDTFSAPTAVIATPSGIWPRIEFSPALSADRASAAREGMQVPRGSRIVAVIRGESRRFYVQPHAGHPIGMMWSAHQRSSDEQVIGLFGSPTLNDAHDLEEVTAAIQDILPHVEVAEIAAGTYMDYDDFAGGGWPFPKLGQLARFAPHKNFARPEGRLVFATSDIASGWCGFIDGAIESGLRAGRQVREMRHVGSQQITVLGGASSSPAATSIG